MNGGGRETLGALLSRMLGLLSQPDPILPVFEAAAAAECERKRMVAEQRMLMDAYKEYQRQLAAQQAQHPLCLDNGPTAAYFGVSAQQQEQSRQQQELFALACAPVTGAVQQQLAAEQRRQAEEGKPTNGVLAAAAGGLPEAQQQGQQPAQQLPPSLTASNPDGEAAAPSGEPELRAAAATAAAAAEAADEDLALARVTAQAAVAAAVQAVDGQLPGSPRHPHLPGAASTHQQDQQQQQQPLWLMQQDEEEGGPVQQVKAEAEQSAALQPVAAPLPDSLSPAPPPPLPATAAAEAAEEVVNWLAAYSSDSKGDVSGGAGEEGPTSGTLHCRRAGGAGEPPLADAEPAGAAQPADAAPAEPAGGWADGGVLRLRGGGRKRAASAGSGEDGGDAAKRQRGGSAGDDVQQCGPELLGRSIMIYWKEQKTYYTGTVTSYDAATGWVGWRRSGGRMGDGEAVRGALPCAARALLPAAARAPAYPALLLSHHASGPLPPAAANTLLSTEMETRRCSRCTRQALGDAAVSHALGEPPA